MCNPSSRPITIIISPLKAIEAGQARDAEEKFGRFGVRPFVLNGDTNSAENRHKIARGDYTHVWTSADIAIGEMVDPDMGHSQDGMNEQYTHGRETATSTCKNRPPKQKRRVVTRQFEDGYRDAGTFTSVLQDPTFQDRCGLVAIDELHLCAETSWGGGFRIAFGQLSRLRDQLNDHTRLFGTTATLTSKSEVDIMGSAGFRCKEVIRTPVFRPDVFVLVHPTNEPAAICRQVLYTALEEALASPTRLLRKMIFFVDKVRDTDVLQGNIIRWLESRGERAASRLVWTYHGQLTPSSRDEIEKKFEQGQILILVSTVAYALGVNPPGVKYIVQWGRCSLEDSLQKLGRGARGGLDNGEKALFIWLPEARVQGLKSSQIPIQKRRDHPRVRHRNLRYPGEMPVFSVQDLSDSLQSDYGLPPRSTGRKNCPAKPTDAEWREYKLSPEEYAVFNDSCSWRALLKPFNELLEQPCNNCSRCRPTEFQLAELTREERTRTEDPVIRDDLCKQLEKLSLQLGNAENSRFMRKLCPLPAERVLSSDDRRRLSAAYIRVLKGDLLGWLWAKKYGLTVITFVRCYLGLPPNIPTVPSPSPAALNRLALPSPAVEPDSQPVPTVTEVAGVSHATLPIDSKSRGVLRERPANACLSARGDVAWKKDVRGRRCVKRKAGDDVGDENRPSTRMRMG